MRNALRKCSLWFAVLALGLTALHAAAAEKTATPDLSKDKTLYVVGYAHLDTQWQWTYVDTIRDYLPKTMNVNFGFFKKYPDYVFNFSGANRYRMMKEYYPTSYTLVKKYVADGRWFPCGSSMEEEDVNNPSSESIIRQILYGTHYFRAEFGKTSEEFMLPDCFGFPASLPSLLAHCGIKGFSTQKLSWGSAVGIPFNVGVWEGPNGKSVIAALNPGSYSAGIQGDLKLNREWVTRVNNAGTSYGVYTDYHYYGTGDTGGAPAESAVQMMEASVKGEGPIKVVSSEADAMFKAITPAQAARLPRYKGDLLLTQHSAGSISSQAYMKRWNRKNELLADDAERASVAAQWLGGAIYPLAKLNDAWTLVMGGQFHDILPGTSHPKSYEYSWNDEIVAQNAFAEVTKNAVGAVAQALDTQAKGAALVVYNPLSIAREEVVEAAVALPAGTKAVTVTGPDGKAAPAQVVGEENGKTKILFLAQAPSVGFAVYDVTAAPAEEKNAELKVTENSLENARYTVKLNAAGDVASIYDKAVGKELLAAPMQLAFQFENPGQYPSWNMDWADQQKPPLGFVDGAAKVKVIENGPLRVALQIEREARGSKFIQRVRLAAGDPGNRVEFADTIDWKTTGTALKATFPLTAANPQATYNWEVGTVQRGNNDPKKFEVPSHQWFDLTDQGGAFGATILSNYKTASDKPSDNTLRLTLIYTPGVTGARSRPDEATQDWGRHEIVYGLAGHKGDWRQGQTDWQGVRLNQEMLVFASPAHAGKLGKSFSLASVSAPNVIVKALKKAEDSSEVIVRLVETQGKDAKGVQVALGAITAAREVNGQERPLGKATVEGGKLVADLGPYAVRAFALKLGKAPAAVAAPKSQAVKLPYNVCVTSTDGNKSTGGFDDQGQALAAEMLSPTVQAEGISFKLGPLENGAKNAVACQGQTIALPQGQFNRVYLLAAATADTLATFKVDGAPTQLPIQSWGGYLGQWDTRVWDDTPPANATGFGGGRGGRGGRPAVTSITPGVTAGAVLSVIPGYMKTAPVAWFASHRHDKDGQNEFYAFSYLFKYVIDLKPGAKELTLPEGGKVRVLALTVAQNENDATAPAQPLLDVLDRTGFEGKDYSLKAPVMPQRQGNRGGLRGGRRGIGMTSGTLTRRGGAAAAGVPAVRGN